MVGPVAPGTRSTGWHLISGIPPDFHGMGANFTLNDWTDMVQDQMFMGADVSSKKRKTSEEKWATNSSMND